jgi:hypothetical protein
LIDVEPHARSTHRAAHNEPTTTMMMFGSTTRMRAMERVTALRRTYAAAGAAKAQSHDVVQRVFVEQQQKFRALLEKTKTLTPPIGGDATAVKAYAAKKLAILKEVRVLCARDGLVSVARARRRRAKAR